MKTHLEGFGLENFRAFKDYTWFDFAPITILTGPNSSGKSSLNKALMLMKDNIKAEDISNGYPKEVKHLITDPLAFKYDGSDHNLSSAANAINNLSESPYISFYFKSQIHGLENPAYFRFKDLVNERAKRLFEGSENLSTVLNKAKIFEILNAERQVMIRMTHGERAAFYCDLPLLLKLCIELVGGLGVEIEENLISEIDTEIRDGRHEELIRERDILKKFIESFWDVKWEKNEVIFTDFFLANGPFTEERCSQPLEPEDLEYYDVEIGYQNFSRRHAGDLETQFKYLLYENDLYHFIKEKNIDGMFPEYINVLTTTFMDTLGLFFTIDIAKREKKKSIKVSLPNLENMYYLPSIKGANERSYRSKDENVLNILFKEYINKYEDDKHLGDTSPRYTFYNKWVQKFGIESLTMERNDRLDANSFNIAGLSHVDIGYGMTQIIAILLRILSIAKKDKGQHPWGYSPILILEEPEANLHPKFQSYLADLFVEAAEIFNIQFIIETHSEYLIRKLQFLTAKQQVKTQDSLIYYFYDPRDIPKDEKQVKRIEILEDGRLSDDFGSGFFDEAVNWELELIRLKNGKNRNN